MSQLRPSASFSATLRVHLDDRPGAFADLVHAIGDAGGNLGAIDLVPPNPGVRGETNLHLRGGADYCASTAGGTVLANNAKSFKVNDAPAPAGESQASWSLRHMPVRQVRGSRRILGFPFQA